MESLITMEKTQKIYIAGIRGMAGSAIARKLDTLGYRSIIGHSSTELDLTSQSHVYEMFAKEKPDYVFIAAAKVGGIHANNTYPAEFIYSNLIIQNHLIHASYLFDVKKVLFLGSSCIYPRMAPQPIKEEHLLTGLLEPTNEPYAIAKIAGIKMCESYNRQYGTNFITCMPTNLFGPNDNYHPENSHVLPALIRRIHEAKVAGASSFTVWGTGTPLREFLFVDDLADACVFLMNNYDNNGPINVGSSQEHSIAELANTIANVIGFGGEIIFDRSKPDGSPRKLMDSSRINAMGWKATTNIEEGIRAAYQDFLKSDTRL